MSQTGEERRVLEMLAKGTIGVDDAARLLEALRASDGGAGGGEEKASTARETGRGAAKYLRIHCQDGSGDDDINLKIPLSLVQGGARLGALLPESVRERMKVRVVGCGVSNLSGEDLFEAIENLEDLDIDIQEGGGSIRIYCE